MEECALKTDESEIYSRLLLKNSVAIEDNRPRVFEF
jgi:hypothetical protein